MRIVTLIVGLLLWLAPAVAEEVIRKFTSDVTVNVDGSLDVKETITIWAEGREIRRGIRRDIPTLYTDRNKVQVRVPLDVLGVTRNGAEEAWATEALRNGLRIRIGNADIFLDQGEHIYEIRYRTKRQIGFFPEFDELYWNVTGNGWTFPIEHAAVNVSLPNEAQIGAHAIYTGLQGERGGDGRVTVTGGNRFAAVTTRSLAPGEGFTIALNWQKGIVNPPSALERRYDWIVDNLGYFILTLTVLLVPLYYAWAWWRVGRDPPRGTIVPLFKPPEAMGPAGVRYVYRNAFDNRTFAAALVGLAVKGCMTIRNDDDTYTIAKTSRGPTALTRSETALLGHAPAAPLQLEEANNERVRGMMAALENALDDEYDGVMYLKNFKWFGLGFAWTALGLLLAALFMPQEDSGPTLAVAGFSAVWWGVLLTVAYSIISGLATGSGLLSKIRSLMSLIFLVPFVAVGFAVPAFAFFAEEISFALKLFMAAVVFLALCNLVFFWLLKAPTPRGRAVLDHIEGFRMYLSTAEEERLRVLNPPDKTPELFERYLPYAMALDCENEWNDKFASMLAAAAAAGATTGAIGGWYTGPDSFSSRDFSSRLGNSLTSSIASSSMAPGSSSGSGGGGFSGGGGGGGGGSGW